MLTQLNNFIIWLDDVVWGIPLIVLILSVGIYLTVRLGLLQIRHLPRALKYMVKNDPGGIFRYGHQICGRPFGDQVPDHR